MTFRASANLKARVMAGMAGAADGAQAAASGKAV